MKKLLSRNIAFILVLIVLSNISIPFFTALAKETVGIGVKNNLYGSISESEFKVTYLDSSGIELTGIAETVKIGGVTPDSDGKFKLSDDAEAKLSVEDLNNALQSHDIKQIKFQGISDVYVKCYTSEQTYTLDVNVNDEGVRSVSESGYTLRDFTSTEMIDVVVQKYWRDTAKNRPDISFTFNAAANGEEYSNFDQPGTYVKIDNINEQTYTYRLPAYTENGNKITYTVTETMPDDANYRKEENGLTVINTELTEFTCNLVWADIFDSSSRPKVDKELVHLTREYEDSENSIISENIDLAGYNLNYDEVNKTLTISGLDLLEGVTGNKYTYYITLGDDVPGDSCDKIAIDGNDDFYRIEYTNNGTHSAETDRCYDGGSVNGVLSGYIDFVGEVKWSDEENRANRTAVANGGNMVLWRTAGENIEAAKASENAAQVRIDTLLTKNDTSYTSEGYSFVFDGEDKYTFTISNLDKYDRFGKIYYYYIKENLASNFSFYTKIYNNISSETAKLENNGQIDNKLLGQSVYTVSANWIAAARQGGTGKITYALQKLDKTTGEWSEISTIDTGVCTAERMSADIAFAAVPTYDENGAAYQYRVVQKEIVRTDRGITGYYTDPFTIESGTNAQTEITINGDSYEITAERSGTSYTFNYKLIGTKNIDLIKQWSGGNGVHEND